MINSKLIKLVETMGKDELKAFGDFVSSPYFNKDSGIERLFEYIRKQKQGVKSPGVKKETAYAVVFSGKKYNDKLMRNAMSKLLKLGERFIYIRQFENKATDKFNYLLDGLLTKQLSQHYENVYTDAMKLIAEDSRNEKYFYNTISILSSRRNYELAYNIKMENVFSASKIFEPLFGFLFVYFVKISHTTMVFKRNYENYSVPDMEPEYRLLTNMYQYITPRAEEYKPVFDIYYNLFMMNYMSKDEKYFREFSVKVNEHSKLFSAPDLPNFFVAMPNYCIIKKAEGHPDYEFIQFEINREMLSKNAISYIIDGKINPLVFKNIVKDGLAVKEFDWTGVFIEEYVTKLRTEFGENLFHFSHALLNFR